LPYVAEQTLVKRYPTLRSIGRRSFMHLYLSTVPSDAEHCYGWPNTTITRYATRELEPVADRVRLDSSIVRRAIISICGMEINANVFTLEGRFEG
jgi:hypothetical protein